MRRVTIRDVAKKAGVSITTVSKALNNYPDISPQTKRHVEDVVRKMNYVPDTAGRSMGGITDPVVGLIINDLKPEEPSGSVYGILSGVCHACKDNDMGFLLLATDSSQQETVPLKQLVLSKGLSGLVFSGFRLDQPYIQQMKELDIPCVCIDMELGDPDIVNIATDNLTASEQAVRFLIDSGRRHIALFHGSAAADVSNRRKAGYCRAMAQADLPVEPGWMVNAEFDQEIAYTKAGILLRQDARIDAVFCISDLMAFGVCRAIEEAGLAVGRDVAVIGFDDIPIARYLFGGLTTIRQNFYNMGYTAGSVTLGRILGKPHSTVGAWMPYELVVRRTAQEG